MDSVKPSRIGTVEKAGFMILRMEPTGEGGVKKQSIGGQTKIGQGQGPVPTKITRIETNP